MFKIIVYKIKKYKVFLVCHCNFLHDPCRRGDLMSLFDEPIMIDGKEVGYKPPEESELIDLEKLCPWLARPSKKKSSDALDDTLA